MYLLKDSLKKTLKKLGIEKPLKEKKVIVLWNQLRTGELIRHTQAHSFKNGILFVNVSSPVWSQQLIFLKGRFLKEINQQMESRFVKDIRFQCGQIAIEEGQLINEEILVDILLEEQEIKQIQASIAEIKEERLKHCCELFLIKNQKMRKWREQKGWKICTYCSCLYPPKEKKCPYCQVEKELSQLLLGNPYYTYPQCLIHFSTLLETQYEEIKEKLLCSLKEKISLISFNQLFFAEKEKLMRYTHLIQSYIILKTELELFAITTEVIYDILGKERADHYYSSLEKLKKGG